jgi:Fic family protein
LESVARLCTLVLDSSAYPDGFSYQSQVIYRPESREVVVEWELPPESVIPVERGYKYHPVLLSGLFILDLLVIHPSEDGNGRVARLLTGALLGEHGYTVGRYGASR